MFKLYAPSLSVKACGSGRHDVKEHVLNSKNYCYMEELIQSSIACGKLL